MGDTVAAVVAPLLRLPEATSTAELWPAMSPEAMALPLHPAQPLDLEDAIRYLERPRIDSTQFRSAAIRLGALRADDDEPPIAFVARAWLEGRASLHVREVLRARSDVMVEPVQNLADLAQGLANAVRPSPAKSFFAVQVLYEGNLGCAGASVRVVLPDGEQRTLTLDGNSGLRVDGIEPGTCAIELPEPLPLPGPDARELVAGPIDGSTATIARDGHARLRSGASHRVLVRGACLELALDLGERQRFAPGCRLRLRGGGYDRVVPLSQARDHAGLSMFHFHGVRRGLRYALTFEPEADPPVTLFEDQSLDGFFDVLGDRQAAVEPIVLACTIAPPPPHQTEPAAGPAVAQRDDTREVRRAPYPWEIESA